MTQLFLRLHVVTCYMSLVKRHRRYLYPDGTWASLRPTRFRSPPGTVPSSLPSRNTNEEEDLLGDFGVHTRREGRTPTTCLDKDVGQSTHVRRQLKERK